MAAVPPSVVRDHLDRVVASAAFARAERLKRFLRFVVEQTIAGGRATSRNRPSRSTCAAATRRSTRKPIRSSASTRRGFAREVKRAEGYTDV